MTLAEVEAAVRDALERLNHPCPDFRFDRTPFGDATPHVEGDGPEFDWVVSERGVELERRRVDGEELLFITLNSITASMARQEELATRTSFPLPLMRRLIRGAARATIDDDYSRKTWMDAHERLMRHLRHDWGARVHMAYEETLRRAPLTPEERKNVRRLDLSDYGIGEGD